jgi:Zn-dependent peptidase ImmA (M78 family)/transcriptional regulator with XRE-family HTH domain
MTTNRFESIDPVDIGAQLMHFRKARGLKQQDAADVLGVARTTIVAMEKGERRPKPEELMKLANLYGRQVGDFLRPQTDPSPEPFVVQFRSAKRGASDDDDAINRDIAAFQELCENYLELERLTSSPMTQRYPGEYEINGIDPEHAAEEVAAAERNRLGLGDAPIGNIWSVLESDVGLRVFMIEFESRNTAGLFVHTAALGGCIAVNAKHPEERRRLSLAHEYGHFLTNRHRPDVSRLSSYRRAPDSERFADAFARYFLMPPSGIVRRFNSHSRARQGSITTADVVELSHQYGVSFQAMILWLQELKLVRSTTWDRLKDAGFKIGEAKRALELEDLPQRRHQLPYRYRSLAVQAYLSEELSEGQLADYLRTDRVAARRTVSEFEGTQFFDDGEILQLSLDFGAALRQ